MKKWIWMLGTVSFAFCGGGKDDGKLMETVDKNFSASLDDIAKAEKKDVACDGQGQEFSGNYTVTISDFEKKCTGDFKAQGEGNAVPATCIQDNQKFSCKINDVMGISYEGCIGQDGQFKLSGQKTLTANSIKQDIRIVLLGKINGQDGIARQFLKGSGEGKAGACDAKAKLNFEQASQ